MKILKAVLKFVYRVSGLRSLVSALESFVFRYKLRVRMVPVSYKLFILMLGAFIGGSGVFVSLSYPNALESNSIIIENTRVMPVEAKELPIESKEVVKERSIEELADYIWMKESTRGKHNYSKCEAIGKVNGIGYAIPGDGSYVCFDSHEDEMVALNGWLMAKKAAGWSELKMLCTYSGSNYAECTK